MDDSTFDPDSTTPTKPFLNITNQTTSTVSPLEQEVLDEYTRLLDNMDQLTSILQTLATGPITLEVADSLRLLERKVTSVYTLMKASVYSIVLQQGQMDGSNAGGDGGNNDTTLTIRASGGGGYRDDEEESRIAR